MSVKERIGLIENMVGKFLNAYAKRKVGKLSGYAVVFPEIHELISTGEPAVVLNAIRTVEGMKSVMSHAVRTHMANARNIKPNGDGPKLPTKSVEDRDSLFLEGVRAYLTHYTTKNKPKQRSVYKRLNTSKYDKTFMTRSVSYKSSLIDKAQNKACIKPFMSYRFEDIRDMYKDLEEHLVPLLKEVLEQSSVREYYETRAKKEIVPFIRLWNEASPTMPLREEVNVEVTTYCDLRIQLRNASGKKILHYDRNVSHWILDGLYAYSKEAFKGNMELDEWYTVLSFPSLWINLDNYKQFVSDSLSIEIVDPRLLDETENVKALSIGGYGVEDYDRKLVFFRKKDDKYVPINSNKKEASLLLKRFALVKGMLSN